MTSESTFLTVPVSSERLEIMRFHVGRVMIRFAIDNPKDVIQNCHVNGTFYEDAELRDLSLCIPAGAIILDIGANVGNHMVYFGKMCRVAKIVCFEPNPRAISLLEKNIRLNNIEKIVDVSHLGIALGAKSGFCEFIEDPRWASGNLGAATLVISDTPTGSLPIQVRSLDELNLAVTPDLIKIDVEGMELEVLRGAIDTIRRCRPVLYVEVSPRSRATFREMMSALEYRIERTHQRHRNVVNFLCTPW